MPEKQGSMPTIDHSMKNMGGFMSLIERFMKKMERFIPTIDASVKNKKRPRLAMKHSLPTIEGFTTDRERFANLGQFCRQILND